MFEVIIVAAIVILVVTYKKGIIHYVTAALWLLYPFYEVWVQYSCTGECNIRVDLLIIFPIIFVYTAVSVVWIFKKKKFLKTQQ